MPSHVYIYICLFDVFGLVFEPQELGTTREAGHLVADAKRQSNPSAEALSSIKAVKDKFQWP